MIIYINNTMPKKLKEQRKKIMARKAADYNQWLNTINNMAANRLHETISNQ